MKLQITGAEYETEKQALEYSAAEGFDDIILIGGKVIGVEKSEAQRIEGLGVSFAYLCDHELPNGECRMVTVPVN